MFARAVVLASGLFLAPAVAAAQTGGPADPSAASAAAHKDSKWNGALIGAGLGAVAGAFIGSAAIECSECAGFNVPLTFGVIGAGGGAAIGAGIDARFSRRAIMSNPSGRGRRLGISLVVARHVKAARAAIRF